jgi:acyl-CoA synthetase (NDP forming)
VTQRDATDAGSDAASGRLLGPQASYDLLSQAGIPMPQQVVVSGDADAAAQAAETLGFSVVLKAVAPALVHKSDAGGVRVGLGDAAAVRAAATEMLASIDGVEGLLLQRQVHLTGGLEMIVGCRRDAQFGPVVLVGLGGVWVEALQDVAVRLAPVSRSDAHAMLAELRGAALLDGFRGQPPIDREALVEVIERVSALALAEPRLLELDLNPVIVGPQAAVAVDGRVIWDADAGAGQWSAYPESRERTRAAVQRILNPQSIAVVGASTDARKPGGRLFHYLLKHGYRGNLVAVNPGTSEVMGRPSYPTLAVLPEPPDLICVMVPAETIPMVLAGARADGQSSAIVYTAGFGETGAAGVALQERVLEAAAVSGVRFCGPNTAGVVNANAATCAAFGMAFEVDEMPTGNIAFLTQSGALGSSLLSRTWATGIGFSHWICTGNEADLTLSDYLDVLVDDPDAQVIAIFMESLRDPQGFIAAAKRAQAIGKPIVVYKTGTSAVGQRAGQSHTGSLAGDDRMYAAAFQACGVARVHDLQALVDAAIALAWQPRPRGRRVGVISASGGACSVIADECARHGLEVPLLADATLAQIRAIIPPFGAAQNPVDVTVEVTRNPEMIGQVTELLLADEGIDAVVVLMTTNADPPALTVAQGVVRAVKGATKPVIVTRVGAEFLAPASVALYQESRLPLYPMPDRAVKALRAMVEIGAVPDAT